MKEENNISDVELSLISAISSLDNKLEELDHNISLLAKSSKDASSVFDEKEMSNKIKDLENKISDLSVKVNNENKGKTNQKYLNTTPSNKGRSLNQKKGYAIAENLRLKRIDAIEKSLNDLNEFLFIDDETIYNWYFKKIESKNPIESLKNLIEGLMMKSMDLSLFEMRFLEMIFRVTTQMEDPLKHLLLQTLL